jgi:hypothetical protein
MGTGAETNWPQNSSGERKATIFMRVAQALFPEMYEQEPKTLADRVKAKIEWYVIFILQSISCLYSLVLEQAHCTVSEARQATSGDWRWHWG